MNHAPILDYASHYAALAPRRHTRAFGVMQLGGRLISRPVGRSTQRAIWNSRKEAYVAEFSTVQNGQLKE
jgi:hypothetical protein